MADGFNVMVATAGTPHRKFAASLLHMFADYVEWSNSHPLRHTISFNFQPGSILPQLRHRMVRRAQSVGATHILFIDSDQSFPPTTLRRLLSHRLPVVACNVATKTVVPSPLPTARHKGPGSGHLVHPKGTGVERVWRVGCGIMMVEMSVFDRVPPPWFEVRYIPEIDDFEGEDWYFCRRLEEHGIGVSEEVGHWGEFEFRLSMVPDRPALDAAVKELVNAIQEGGTEQVQVA